MRFVNKIEYNSIIVKTINYEDSVKMQHLFFLIWI